MRLMSKLSISFAADSNVDAIVIGLDPLSLAKHTLAASNPNTFSFNNPASIARALPLLRDKNIY